VPLEPTDFAGARALFSIAGSWEKETQLRFMFLKRWACALLACPLAAAAADPLVIVTLNEGPATLVRGVARHALAEGVRLQSGDILEVGDKGLAQIEFADGVAFALGPNARAMLSSLSHGKQAAASFYVAQGALKIARVKPDAHLRIETPWITLQPTQGAAVLVLEDGGGSLFVEGGEVRVAETHAARGAVPLRLKSGEFYAGKAGQRAAVTSRPTPAFIGALPRLFLDPLPARMARYRDRPVQPRQLDLVSYAQVEIWLKAPPAIRRPLLARFRPRAHDPAFRAALVANLRFHPEWDPILFPEKYLPKEPGQDAAHGAPAPARPINTL
jgi:hypothetical protein